MSTQNSFHDFAETVQQELKQVISEIGSEDVERFVQALVGAERIFITGKGRTGLQMESFAMRLMHLGLSVYVVGDVTTPGINTGDLLVIGSASGNTQSLIGYAQSAEHIGAKLISITSNHQNPISKLSEITIIIPAPSHKNSKGSNSLSSIQPLAGLFELALGMLLNILVLHLMDNFEVDESAMVPRHANLE